MKTYRALSRVAAGCLLTSLTLFGADRAVGAARARHTPMAKRMTIAFIPIGLTNSSPVP